jgi:DNA-binding MarR family transcriptional regulator
MVAQLTSHDVQIAQLHDLIQQVRRVGAEYFAAQLEEFGLTPMQHAALEAIDRLGPDVAIGAVSDALRASPGAMAGLTNRLVTAGLIERYAPPENRRAVLVRTTPAGRDVVLAFDARRNDVRRFRDRVGRRPEDGSTPARGGYGAMLAAGVDNIRRRFAGGDVTFHRRHFGVETA